MGCVFYMNKIAISSLTHAAGYVIENNPEFILSIIDPGSNALVTPGTACKKHLILECHDVVQVYARGSSDYIVPNNIHIEKIVELGRHWGGHICVFKVSDILHPSDSVVGDIIMEREK